MQFSRAGPVSREQNSDDVRHSRSQCRWCLLLLYITHGYKRGSGLCVAEKLWQKSTIPATVSNVEMASALVLLQSDSQDHGTTDYALCPHYMLWHIATFNSSANWKTKGQELIHKKVKSPRGLRLVEGEILIAFLFTLWQKVHWGIMYCLILEKVRPWLAKVMTARNGFLVPLLGSVAWPD